MLIGSVPLFWSFDWQLPAADDGGHNNYVNHLIGVGGRV